MCGSPTDRAAAIGAIAIAIAGTVVVGTRCFF